VGGRNVILYQLRGGEGEYNKKGERSMTEKTQKNHIGNWNQGKKTIVFCKMEGAAFLHKKKKGIPGGQDRRKKKKNGINDLRAKGKRKGRARSVGEKRITRLKKRLQEK